MPGISSDTALDIATLRAVLDAWQAGIAAHDPGRVAAVFTEDAVFQGLQPYSVGRAGVIAYYASQPAGLTVAYRILQTRRLADDVVLGYVRADFRTPDGTLIPLYLGVVVTGGLIAHYQVSAMPA